jgi:uncharacterized membrane protein
MTRWIMRTFVKGLAVVLPIAAGAYVVLWLIRDTEALLKDSLIEILPKGAYVPGMGLAVLLAAIFLIGLLMYPWLTRKLFDRADGIFRKVPVFGTVYGPMRDLMDMFGGDMTEQLGQCVMVRIPGTDIETLGFVTRSDLSNLPEGFKKEGHVVVYVQWSSQVGGYCFILPEEDVRPVKMSVEEGMRWALTAGVSGPKATADAQAQSGTASNGDS